MAWRCAAPWLRRRGREGGGGLTGVAGWSCPGVGAALELSEDFGSGDGRRTVASCYPGEGRS
jgi:hypothetical protein